MLSAVIHGLTGRVEVEDCSLLSAKGRVVCLAVATSRSRLVVLLPTAQATELQAALGKCVEQIIAEKA